MASANVSRDSSARPAFVVSQRRIVEVGRIKQCQGASAYLLKQVTLDAARQNVCLRRQVNWPGRDLDL